MGIEIAKTLQEQHDRPDFHCQHIYAPLDSVDSMIKGPDEAGLPL